MAEFGLAASIIQIVGMGLKLSMTTFDFAASIGRAGKDLQTVAIEISDLCAVLNHLQAVLNHAHFRPSAAAFKDAQKLIQHCRTTFSELDEVVSSLRNSKSSDLFPAATPDFIDKVKWTLKKSKVQMQRSTLEACKSTLSLMLNTMMLAESVSQRSAPGLSLSDVEQDRTMTQSLVIAQQCALEQLEHYEDEVEREEDSAQMLPEVNAAHHTTTPQRRKSRGRLVNMFSGLSVITDLPRVNAIKVSGSARFERASLWLDKIIAAPDDQFTPHPGQRKQKRLSSAGTANAPLQLLRKWTEQVEQLDRRSRAGIPDIANNPTGELWQQSEFSFPDACIDIESKTTNKPDKLNVGISRVSSDLVSPKTASARSIGLPRHSEFHGVLGMNEETTSITDDSEPYEALIKSILQQYRASINHDSVTLGIYFGGKSRDMKPSDLPAKVFEHYEELGLDPKLFVRSRISTGPESRL